MGPDDYIKMVNAWIFNHKIQRREDDRLLYVLRFLAVRVHNALVTRQSHRIKDPADLIKLSTDDPERKEKWRKKMRAASDQLFSKAKQRGSINGQSSSRISKN